MKTLPIFRLSLAAIIAVQTVFIAGIPLTNAIVVPFDGTFIKNIVQTNQVARAEQKASYSIALGANIGNGGVLYPSDSHSFRVDGFLFSFRGSNTNTVTANSALIQTPAYNYVTSNMPALTALTVSILPSFVSPNSGIAYNVTAADRYLTFITAGTETRDGTNIDTSNFSINSGWSFYVAGLSARTDRPEIVDFTPTNVGTSANEEFVLTLSGSTYTATGTTVAEVTSRLASAVLANPSPAGTCTDMTTKIQCTSVNGATSLMSSVSVNHLTPDTTPPVVTLVGSGSMDIPFGGVYSELGATWTDNRDQTGVLTGATVGSVNTNMVGLQTLTYRYTDMAGNASNSVNRAVTIIDSTPPIVTLLGTGALTVERGTVYTDSGATWTDDAEGSGSLILANASGSINLNATGSYLIEYSKTDASGNISNTVSRTITVEDTTPPALTITTQSGSINASSYPIRGTTTGDASSVTISGGSGAIVHAILTGSGAFSALVPLTANSANTLIVTASDASGNSTSGSVVITAISGVGSSFSGALVIGSGSTLGDVSSTSGTGGITSTTLVTLQTPISFVGSGSGSRVTLPADTTIRTASGTAFNGSSIGAFTGAALTLASNEASNGTFSFGLANTSLHFSKPIKIEIPLSNYTGNSILIKVQHTWESSPGTVGLTNNPNSTCTNGVAGSPSDTASVVNSVATIYTCSASTFVGYSAATVVSSGGGGGGGGGAPLPASASSLITPVSTTTTPPPTTTLSPTVSGGLYTLVSVESKVKSKRSFTIEVIPSSGSLFTRPTLISVSTVLPEGSRVRITYLREDGKKGVTITRKVTNSTISWKTKKAGKYQITRVLK